LSLPLMDITLKLWNTKNGVHEVIHTSTNQSLLSIWVDL
jgi:hypothetical protein